MNSTLLKWFSVLWPALCCAFSAFPILHYFQLDSYQYPGFFRSILRNKRHSLLPGLFSSAWLCFLYLIIAGLTFCSFGTVLTLIFCVLFSALSTFGGIYLKKLFSEKKAKKPFVYTPRMKRLYCVMILVMILVGWLCSLSSFPLLPELWPIALPLVVAVSGLLAWPVEKAISECYFRDARRQLLSNPNRIRIGITGSYGKTSVKHILGTILSEKYPTFVTPASYNTPMGVSRAIREHLTPSHQIFIGEMGARHVGDIKEMCRLVKPTIGIITSVGPQHLETFKTVERVASTKYELIEALPNTESKCYFFDDHSFCKKMYDKTRKAKTLCGEKDSDADVWYEDVSVSAQGSSFTLAVRNGESICCTTRLLGEHNIRNVTLAAAVALDLGLSLKQISRGIEKLRPIQSRLELISVPGSFTIINDAFNSNPVGAKAALDVLRAFPKRRIVITPGMVELGENEAEYNREFGRQIGKCADVAIIIGKNRVLPIIDGLKETGFPPENIHQVNSLESSTVCLNSFVSSGDTVLYENDLPDHYQEA